MRCGSQSDENAGTNKINKYTLFVKITTVMAYLHTTRSGLAIWTVDLRLSYDGEYVDIGVTRDRVRAGAFCLHAFVGQEAVLPEVSWNAAYHVELDIDLANRPGLMGRFTIDVGDFYIHALSLVDDHDLFGELVMASDDVDFQLHARYIINDPVMTQFFINIPIPWLEAAVNEEAVCFFLCRLRLGSA